jgi:hypothetical protein
MLLQHNDPSRSIYAARWKTPLSRRDYDRPDIKVPKHFAAAGMHELSSIMERIIASDVPIR